MEHNKTMYNQTNIVFSAPKLNIPMKQKKDTLKQHSQPIERSVVIDADRSFISNDGLSQRKSSLARIKSLRPGPQIIQKLKKNSSLAKRRCKVKAISHVLKENRKSSMSKKTIIKKSISLLKQGLLKKLTTDLNSIGEPKPKKKPAQVENFKIKAKSPDLLQPPQNYEINSMNSSFRLSDELRSMASKDSS